MNYNNIDNRLDIDNYFKNVVDNYPKNDDDFIFYMRGKISTGEFFASSVSDSNNLIKAFYSLYLQNIEFKDIIDSLFISVNKIK
jgi:hypothetical protein